MNYQEFLESKIQIANPVPDTISAPLDPSLFPHQQAMTKWALDNGRGLIAASFGLGKSRVQCAIAKALVEASGRPFLVVCPLGVKRGRRAYGVELNIEYFANSTRYADEAESLFCAPRLFEDADLEMAA